MVHWLETVRLKTKGYVNIVPKPRNLFLMVVQVNNSITVLHVNGNCTSKQIDMAGGIQRGKL